MKLHKEGIDGKLFELKDWMFMDEMCEIGLCHSYGDTYDRTFGLTRIGYNLLRQYENQ